MELALNLVWLVSAAVLIGAVYAAARRGSSGISMPAAIVAAVLIAFVLLPVISVTDDYLEAQQAALPLSGQTWRVAAEGIWNGMDALAAFALCLVLLACVLQSGPAADVEEWIVRPHAARLVRSQRLRPPPRHAAL